jgi:hypothetical protein
VQVLNVPVGPLAVMTDASPQTSGAIRAADINVPAGAQAQGAQSPDADGAGAGAGEQQDVGAGLGGRHGSIVERRGGRSSPEAWLHLAYLRRRIRWEAPVSAREFRLLCRSQLAMPKIDIPNVEVL